MPIPVANLRPALESARAACDARLAELFTRMHFILGEQVAAFETEFAQAMGGAHAIGVGNGTDAISLSLRDAKVSGEVLTTALTAPFSGIGILAAGCKPRFADIHPDTLQIDPDDAGNRLNRKTAAILAVHLYGQPCPLDRLKALARREHKILIQDACQAHGATFQGKPLAAWSSHLAYSFYPTKNLGCLGDGGAIVTSRRSSANNLRMLRDGGRKGGQVSFIAGINSRLDEMQACYLRAFLPRLAAWNEERCRFAAFYDAALADCPGIVIPRRTPESVCHLYPVRAAKRKRLRDRLAAQGIGTGIHYPVPLHLHPAFAGNGLKRGDLPVAEKICTQLVSLPLWPGLKTEEAEQVVLAIRSFYRR